MTKVIIFGEEEKISKEKSIELCYVLQADDKVVKEGGLPSVNQFDNVCLLGKSYDDDYDLIMCWYNDDAHCRFIYLGHWNDGVI